ncbi:MAG: carbon-nitrogen hydrolase family protein [Acidimicrobiaceae bacterium]|nr:carbon-nitrogen hydrolase family protein [Acidimicrobiaceae bacterium]
MNRIIAYVVSTAILISCMGSSADARKDKWPFKEMVTVSCVNFTPITGDKAVTLAKIKDFTVKAARQGANIIVFPELALVGIPKPADVSKIAEPIPGPSTQEIAKLAKEHNVFVIFGMIEEQGTTFYNAAAVVGPGGIMGAQHKVHPIAFMEPWAAKGKEYKLFETPYGPIGIGICYSTYCFPETARCYAARGARLFLKPTAFPEFPDCSDFKEFYMTVLGTRAIENSMFVASSNMVGMVGGYPFFGYSGIFGPKPGYMSYQMFAGPATEKKEAIVTASLNLKSLEYLPDAVSTILEDRNPEMYKCLVAPVATGLQNTDKK